MNNHKLEPLSEKERIFAENNHNLIYSFLRKNGYDIEDFYNVVIMGYLKAVQVYHRREDIKEKYDFTCISCQYMKSSIRDYFKAMNAEKRKPAEKIISLDADYAETENFYNYIGGKLFVEDEVMGNESLKNLLENLSDVQRKITEMKMDGYNNKEIYLILEIKPSTYYKELQRIKSVLEKLVS